VNLVVARYKEDLSWINELPKFDKIMIYDKENESILSRVDLFAFWDKSGFPVSLEILPNVGREVHSFLWHMIMHEVDKPTLFLQGNPFAHIPKEQLMTAIYGYVEGFDAIGTNWHYCDAWGHPHHPNLPVGRFYQEVTGKEINEIRFIPGGQFIVDRNPKDLYKIIEVCDRYPEYPWIMERLWSYVF
jgi:hypothetical protein